ncbi:MAG: hypothetical protein JO243_19700 [Solirubrobacterales bacterium]|nr:hypothetical protein [Solirubrobacterales bacterium]
MAKLRTLPALAAAFAAAELGILVGPAPIRVAGGVILVLLPGLLIMRVIGPQMQNEGAEQLLLAAGVSLAVVVIMGLVLNSVGIRLTSAHWAAALGLVTAVGLVSEAPLEGRDKVGQQAPRKRWLCTELLDRRGITLAAAFAIATLAASAAVVIDVLGQRARYSRTASTELWAVPLPGAPPVAELGVRSLEPKKARYSIRVSIDGRLVRTQALTLRPGQTWQSTQLIGRSGDRVYVALMTLPRGGVYRQVHLTTG